MTTATFLAGIVFALLLGAGLAGLLVALWIRARNATETAARAAGEARAAGAAAQPLGDTLTRIEAQLRELESARHQMLGGLEAQLAGISKETVALAQALRGPNARGRWGELTLRRVAELAGMSAHCDFTEQTSAGPADRRRPDMLVHLPGGRSLPVDAKAPLSAYLDAEAAPDAAARNQALDRHAQQLWRHVGELAARDYWSQFATAPELVVLFLPGEHFLGAALERRRELLDDALSKKVLIATPVTLVSVLKGVAYGWRQEQLADNAEQLRRIGGEFHERMRVFGEYFADSGRHLKRAVEAYNRSVASWDARLAPALRRMQELGVGGSRKTAEPVPIDTAAREPVAGLAESNADPGGRARTAAASGQGRPSGLAESGGARRDKLPEIFPQ